MAKSTLELTLVQVETRKGKGKGKGMRNNAQGLGTRVLNKKSKMSLAVMVYIHGGAYFTGTSYEFSPYVLMNEDIILVTIQYRLGILGFLSTEDEILPGNMGLKDQQLALKWVQQNIECFGGDPNLVTIFGGSSGGSSVHLQMLSPGSR
ncbi:putative sodium-dependent multivitamin transporter, partial [Armadillidium vulgare]